jgi:hypothetical protein
MFHLPNDLFYNFRITGLDDAAQTLLYGGGDVKWGSGTAQSGNIVAASSTGIGSGVFSSLSSFGCRFISSKQVSPFVKGPVRKILRAASTALSKLPSTASKVDFDAGTGQLTVTFRDSAAPVQVVTLDPTVMKQFASMAVVNYNSVSSFMVINVAGKRDVRIEGKILAAQLSAGRTIWNLFEHQGPLVLETTELRGSLLAVDSDLVPAVSAIIIGQAIVRSTGVPSSSVFSSLNADGTALIPAPANESEISALSGDAQQLSKLEFKQKQCIGLPIMRLFPNLDEDGSFIGRRNVQGAVWGGLSDRRSRRWRRGRGRAQPRGSGRHRRRRRSDCVGRNRPGGVGQAKILQAKPRYRVQEGLTNSVGFVSQ